MTVLQFALLGIGLGAVYGLLSNGLVLIYRGSGILNFAHGAFAMVGAFVFWEMHFKHGRSYAVAFVSSLVVVGAIGAATHLVVMRRLRHASALARLIATLGILTLLEGAAGVRYDGGLVQVPGSLPAEPIHFGSIILPRDRPIMLGIAIVLAVALHWTSRHTLFGIATSAVAENQRAAASLGWSPDVVATVTWTGGAMLAAVAGILIVPLSGLNATQLTLVVIAAFASALAAGFSSYGVALSVGVAIGMVQSLMARYVTQPGAADAIPFVVIMLVLIVRGRSLPVRREILERLPSVGSGAVRPTLILPIALVLAGLMQWVFPTELVSAVTVQLIVSVILLSVVVTTGYAGQLSLAQYGLAGIGGYVSGRLASAADWPFAPALVAGVVGAALVGVLFGLPALRTRGVNLAVVTLGLGFTVQVMLFNNNDYTGGISGTDVGAPSFLGLDIDPIKHPTRYGLFCLVCFVVAAVAIGNLRRGRAGRGFIAVRSNERAAAALGVNVVRSKLLAFALGSAVAGLGGVLLAFKSHIVIFGSYDMFASISAVTFATIGGVGYLAGALLGAGLAAGGIGSWILNRYGGLDPWLGVIAGASVLLMLMQNPDGLAGAASHGHADPLTNRLVRSARRLRFGSVTGEAEVRSAPPLADVWRAPADAVLSVDDLTVRFGGVTALAHLSLSVRPGEVVGLIGPNGAGKTTAIDAITGFVRPTSGAVSLGTTNLDHSSVHRRAALGLTRSFQSVELFDEMTVLENLQVASDRRDLTAYLSNLVDTRRPELPPIVDAAVATFGLEPMLTTNPPQLSYGSRRLVGLARAVATRPCVLLLDEPAAGLNRHESRELADAIRNLASQCGIGILLVEHDMSVVMAVCDRITVLDFGSTIADGTPAEIRHDPAVIAAYLGTPRQDTDTSAVVSGAPLGAQPGEDR